MKAATTKRVGLPTWQVQRLAGEARLDPRTVVLVLEGKTRENRRQQVIDAAARLNIDLPFDETGQTRVRAT